MTAKEIVEFWFAGENRRLWFDSNEECDALVGDRFGSTWEQARDGELDHWAETAIGALALVIVLDQFPLNMFRGEPRAWSTEARSREIAAAAIARGLDRELNDEQKVFLYMPYMHSESLADQDRAVELFERAGLHENVRWANHHRDIVQRFGRFPHRNGPLGRASTSEEEAWLASDEAFLG